MDVDFICLPFLKDTNFAWKVGIYTT
jgi:hypothetical protein